MTDLTSLTLAQARERLRKKEITALELTDAHIGAVEQSATRKHQLGFR